MNRFLFTVKLWLVMVLVVSVSAEEVTELKKLSLEELTQIEVTSVSKKEEPLHHAAAAVFVITSEDIRRSGATSIPEVLRLAPGVEVARMTGNQWAISIRGLNGLYANKLLVLIDGRSVYTPVFGGVFWSDQDVLLEDVERIEVVRGPGATMWGANAVNGVINIITKNARATQGFYAKAVVGTEERGAASARYGWKLADDWYARVYEKGFSRDAQALPGDHTGRDDWWQTRGGFRVDGQPNERNRLTLQGDVFAGENGDTAIIPVLTPPFRQAFSGHSDVSGGNMQGRWTHACLDGGEMSLQLYYDRLNHEIFRQTNIEANTFDVDLQHRWRWGDRQEIVWGLGYRHYEDDIQGSNIQFVPGSREMNSVTVFVQDEISLVPDKWRLAVGSKLEHKEFSGWEAEPSVRLSWTPTTNQTLWAAVSRAVRTPTRVEQDIRILAGVVPGSPPMPVIGYGNPDFRSEELWAFELGYRLQVNQHLNFDAALFYNLYDGLRFLANRAPSGITPPPGVIPLMFVNGQDGAGYGGELVVNWQALDWWRLQARYSLLQLHLHPSSATLGMQAGDSPQNMLGLRSTMDLPHRVQLDCGIRYVDSLSKNYVAQGGFDVGSYVAADVRLAWRVTPHWELSVVGQNVFDHTHSEFGPPGIVASQPTMAERSVYGMVRCWF